MVQAHERNEIVLFALYAEIATTNGVDLRAFKRDKLMENIKRGNINIEKFYSARIG